MIFASPVFLCLFLPAVLVIYYNPIIKSIRFKNIFLFLASISFYAWGEPVFIFLVLFSTLLTWLLSIRLKGKKWLLTVGVIYHILIMFIFKYLTFISKELNLLIGKKSFDIDIALPIGISFLTFQLMSYLFDVYYGDVKAQKFLYVGLYALMFPQLIAGPIVRYKDVSSQIEDRIFNNDLFISGMRRFIYGLGKKILLADNLAILADTCFLRVNYQSVVMAWIGAIAYSLQIYFDFSGYSDMAIGLGKMLGFKFNKNFNYPYIANTVTQFWRRWHISLSTWFRDYVYFKGGGSRKGKKRLVLNLFIVWTLTGIWHGANWTFLVWGLIFFVFLVLEKITSFTDKLGKFSYLYTFFVVVMNWIIFRSNNLTDAFNYIKNLFGIGVRNDFGIEVLLINKGLIVVLILGIFGATPLIKKLGGYIYTKRLGFIEPIYIFLVFSLSFICVISSTYIPFIYFNF